MMSENASDDVPTEDEQHASHAGEQHSGRRKPDLTGAVPAPGQGPKDDPDAEAEDRFDAG